MPERGRALLHGFCVGCWPARQFTRRIAICATNQILAVLLLSARPPIIRSPLRMTTAMACARAACFEGFRR